MASNVSYNNLVKKQFSSSKSEYKDGFDVAFIVDEVNYTDEEIAVICEKIRITAMTIWEYSPNATVCVYGLNGNGITHCNWYGRASLSEDDTDGGRALPADSYKRPLKTYKVLKKITVKSGTVAPWFYESGGGTQYMFEHSIQYYIDNGYLVEVIL